MNSTEDIISLEIALLKEQLGAEVGFDPDAMIERLRNYPDAPANPPVSYPPRIFFPQTAGTVA